MVEERKWQRLKSTTRMASATDKQKTAPADHRIGKNRSSWRCSWKKLASARRRPDRAWVLAAPSYLEGCSYEESTKRLTKWIYVKGYAVQPAERRRGTPTSQ